MPTKFLSAAAMLLAAVGVSNLMAGPAAAQPEPGARAWMQCRACHGLSAEDPPRAGPNLHGLFGAKAGTRPGFSYSPALSASKVVWTEATLDAFLKSPSGFIPGNRMPVPGVADDRARTGLVAYLKEKSK